MKRTILLIAAGLFVFSFLTPCFAEEQEQEAIKAAESWLALVDQGNYEESWQQASTLFKRSATVEQWMKAVNDARATLGNVIKREFSSAEAHSSLPGVPDGQYIVLFFKTSFDKKKHGIETITPMLDKDGTWRVAGYYVK